MSDRVLVGVDGSPGAEAATAWAAAYATQTGAEILAVHVLTYSRELTKDLPPTGLTNWRQQLHDQLMGPWTETLRQRGLAHRCILNEADAIDRGLLEVAHEHDATLVVLGAHGHGDLADRVLGGVTYKISHHAHRPVVIVPVDWHTSQST